MIIDNSSAKVRQEPAITRVSRFGHRFLLPAMLALLSVAAVPRIAYAHAHLVRSSPAANSHVTVAPNILQLWFSEGVEPSMSAIVVTGPNGISVSIGTPVVNANDPLLMQATVSSPMPAGTYTVAWRTVAKDGHPSNGKFTFVVEEGADTVATLPATSGTTGVTPSVSDSIQPQAATIATGTGVESVSDVAARWLNFLGLIVVLGTVAFRIFVIPAAVHADTNDDPAFCRTAGERTAMLGLAAAVALVVATVWRLFAERSAIGGVDLRTLLHSHWGQVWHVQLLGAVIACIGFFMATRTSGVRRTGWTLAVLAALMLAVATSLAGHAAAAPQYRNISVSLDILHVLAAGSWLGGLFALTIAGIPTAMSAGDTSGESSRVTAVARLVNAFSPMALTCAGVVVLSGVIAAKLRLGHWAALLDSTYGTVLMVKVAFVLLVIAGGAFNWRRMRGALSGPNGRAATNTFRKSSWFELTAGLIVLAVTAVLVATQPPIH